MKMQVVAVFALLQCAGCSEALAETPIRMEFSRLDDGRIYIDTKISDVSARALVDTGLSSTFLMLPTTAERVRPRYVPFLRTAPTEGVDGVGRRGRFAAVKLTALGGVPGDWDIAAVVLDVPILRADAMLGMKFLKSYDVVIDFLSSTLTLSDEGSAVVPDIRYDNCNEDKPAFALDGVCGSSAVYVDTGGQSTLMNAEMASRLGLPASAQGEPVTVRGASGREMVDIKYDVPLRLGPVAIKSYQVMEFPNRGGCNLPCPELILGMDTLGTLSSLVITSKSIALTQ